MYRRCTFSAVCNLQILIRKYLALLGGKCPVYLHMVTAYCFTCCVSSLFFSDSWVDCCVLTFPTGNGDCRVFRLFDTRLLWAQTTISNWKKNLHYFRALRNKGPVQCWPFRVGSGWFSAKFRVQTEFILNSLWLLALRNSALAELTEQAPKSWNFLVCVSQFCVGWLTTCMYTTVFLRKRRETKHFFFTAKDFLNVFLFVHYENAN